MLLPNTHSVIWVQFLSPISSNVSSVRTWRRLTFLFFTEPVSLNLLACLLIVLGLSTGHPGNFTRNLHRVSEHSFLRFIFILWVYTHLHNESSCLGMSQIPIITITTLTALTSNNNHNQYVNYNVSALQMYVDASEYLLGNWTEITEWVLGGAMSVCGPASQPASRQAKAASDGHL